MRKVTEYPSTCPYDYFEGTKNVKKKENMHNRQRICVESIINRRNIWKIREKCLSLQREYFNLTVMDIQKVNQYKSVFDSIVHEIKDDEGNTMEVWYARELQSVLGYARWENFVVALGRAMESCKSLKINVDSFS